MGLGKGQSGESFNFNLKVAPSSLQSWANLWLFGKHSVFQYAESNKHLIFETHWDPGKKYSQLFSVPIESRYVDPQAPIKLLRCRLPRELKRELLIKRYWRVSTKKQPSVSMKLYFNVQPFTNRKWAISTVKIRFKSYYWITILSCLRTKRKRKIKLSEKQKRKSSWVGKII